LHAPQTKFQEAPLNVTNILSLQTTAAYDLTLALPVPYTHLAQTTLLRKLGKSIEDQDETGRAAEGEQGQAIEGGLPPMAVVRDLTSDKPLVLTLEGGIEVLWSGPNSTPWPNGFALMPSQLQRLQENGGDKWEAALAAWHRFGRAKVSNADTHVKLVAWKVWEKPPSTERTG
jgi:hypothetical protein